MEYTFVGSIPSSVGRSLSHSRNIRSITGVMAPRRMEFRMFTNSSSDWRYISLKYDKRSVGDAKIGIGQYLSWMCANFAFFHASLSNANILLHEPLNTGGIWKKSPHRTTCNPPNGFVISPLICHNININKHESKRTITSRAIASMSLKRYPLIIEISSMTNTFVVRQACFLA